MAEIGVTQVMEPSAGSLMTAANWLAALLTGQLGTILCVLTVAAFGVGLFRGQLSWARGTHIFIGVFILVGAPVIAKGLMNLNAPEETATSIAAIANMADIEFPEQPAQNPDPYAGASMPQ